MTPRDWGMLLVGAFAGVVIGMALLMVMHDDLWRRR